MRCHPSTSMSVRSTDAEASSTHPEFKLRGRFHGRHVELRWKNGELIGAPDDLRAEVVDTVATRRWLQSHLPPAEREEASLLDRSFAQAVLLALLDPDSVELEDPLLDAGP